MTFEMNLNGATRKQLVAAISEITGEKAVYLRTPTYSYKIGAVTVNRDSSIDCPEGTELIELLKGYGFTPATEDEEITTEETAEEGAQDDAITGTEGDEVSEVDSEEADSSKNDDSIWPEDLTVELPNNLTEGQQAALSALVESKHTLLSHALGRMNLPVIFSEEKISFPWFTANDADEVQAYMQLSAALVAMAKRQKRIMAKDRRVDNEKYAFRCFLLRLGFIGDEYRTARRVLLQNLSGDGAWKIAPPKL